MIRDLKAQKQLYIDSHAKVAEEYKNRTHSCWSAKCPSCVLAHTIIHGKPYVGGMYLGTYRAPCKACTQYVFNEADRPGCCRRQLACNSSDRLHMYDDLKTELNLVKYHLAMVELLDTVIVGEFAVIGGVLQLSSKTKAKIKALDNKFKVQD